MISAAVTDVRRARITIGYEIRGLDGELRVEGSTTHAVIGDDGRPQRIPDEFRDAAGRLAGDVRSPSGHARGSSSPCI